MKSKILFLLSLVLLTPLTAAPAHKEAAPGKATETSRRVPLRGVITAVLQDRSALMVKHEAIPGVMRAMTMLFRVDEATLKSAKQGQAITAMMSRQGDEWWLHDVKTVAAPPPERRG
jgi:Cu/Ag efflux protein CusF